MKVVAYIRVSTQKQADHGVSLEAQEAKLKQYADLYELEIVETYVDAGESAKTLERAGLQQALCDLDTGVAEGMVIIKLDRLTRSVVDLGWLLEHYFAKDNGPALMCVNERFDTRTPAGRLILNIMMSVAQWEREETGERTKVAMAHKASTGFYTGGRARYGWAPCQNGALMPVEREQNIIRRVRGMVDDLFGYNQIARLFNEEGVPTRRENGQWYASSIKNIADRAVLEEEATWAHEIGEEVA